MAVDSGAKLFIIKALVDVLVKNSPGEHDQYDHTPLTVRDAVDSGPKVESTSSRAGTSAQERSSESRQTSKESSDSTAKKPVSQNDQMLAASKISKSAKIDKADLTKRWNTIVKTFKADTTTLKNDKFYKGTQILKHALNNEDPNVGFLFLDNEFGVMHGLMKFTAKKDTIEIDDMVTSGWYKGAGMKILRNACKEAASRGVGVSLTSNNRSNKFFKSAGMNQPVTVGGLLSGLGSGGQKFTFTAQEAMNFADTGNSKLSKADYDKINASN
jgi:hypothetical protein